MTTEYLKMFPTENEALDLMRVKNTARRAASNRELFVVVEGPEDDFAVMDLRTAIEMEMTYKWEA